MSEEGFWQYLRPYTHNKIPFLAYWYPKGFGLVRLDQVMVPVAPPYERHWKEENAPKKPHILTKRGRQTWEKNMQRMRKHSWSRVLTVEFDGETLYDTTDGGKRRMHLP